MIFNGGLQRLQSDVSKMARLFTDEKSGYLLQVTIHIEPFGSIDRY